MTSNDGDRLLRRMSDMERDQSFPDSEPRDAATIMLIDRAGPQAKVLLGRRHHSLKFMPGKLVFPGGRIEAHDRAMTAVSELHPGTQAKLLERVAAPSPEFARGMALAAVREMAEETGILLLRVIEGPRVKVRAIEFVGVEAFDPKQLRAQIDTHVALPLVRRGELDEEVLIGDVAALDRFYRDRGYLDVRVDRRIDLSPDNKEAKITFLLAEGRPYTLRAVQAERPLGRGPLPRRQARIHRMPVKVQMIVSHDVAVQQGLPRLDRRLAFAGIMRGERQGAVAPGAGKCLGSRLAHRLDRFTSLC